MRPLFVRYLVSATVLSFTVVTRSGAESVTAPTTALTSTDDRIILLGQPGKEKEDRDINQWQARVRLDPQKSGSYERLGWAFIAKARRTLDAGYYKLAEKTADVMDAHFGPSPESMLLRGHVFHNLHRFHDAEIVAQQLVARRGSEFDYALLSDALMEEGRITEAVAACEKMMALKPGLEAYSRAANLRWLTGDLPGATEVMEDAVRATSPLDATNCAWTLSRLSFYYLQAGNSKQALTLADSAVRILADYPPALLARGRALLALNQPTEAATALQQATLLNPLPEYQWWLADALRASGKATEAAKVEATLKQTGEASDPRTYALFLATRHEETNTAVRLAKAELTNRSDVLTEDALAWALAANGDYAQADASIQVALAFKTQDARLFFHAGEIASARGQVEVAKNFFAEAAKFASTLTPSERALLDRRLGTAKSTAVSGE
jgi:tetratricopeptide (TPR) repeat protein